MVVQEVKTWSVDHGACELVVPDAKVVFFPDAHRYSFRGRRSGQRSQLRRRSRRRGIVSSASSGGYPLSLPRSSARNVLKGLGLKFADLGFEDTAKWMPSCPVTG